MGNDLEKLEKQQSDILLDKGHPFEVDLFFGLKLKLCIRKAKLGTLDYLHSEYAKINYDVNEFAVNNRKEARFSVHNNRGILQRVIAIAALNSYFKIKFFTAILAKILTWRLEPAQVLDLAVVIEDKEDLLNFITTIRFLYQAQRMTSPNLIAEKVLD